MIAGTVASFQQKPGKKTFLLELTNGKRYTSFTTLNVLPGQQIEFEAAQDTFEGERGPVVWWKVVDGSCRVTSAHGINPPPPPAVQPWPPNPPDWHQQPTPSTPPNGKPVAMPSRAWLVATMYAGLVSNHGTPEGDEHAWRLANQRADELLNERAPTGNENAPPF